MIALVGKNKVYLCAQKYVVNKHGNLKIVFLVSYCFFQIACLEDFILIQITKG